ncbi:hypothetical protein T02_5143 [Trichinella nativa]|uniref:Uncharacterized protein n=1 Tax=Trichinella nativa TaxID=6335 RepID=A0A0V1KSJ9_9BILA|nr:hypothetical protein T02_5143 [Trichinella nativa]
MKIGSPTVENAGFPAYLRVPVSKVSTSRSRSVFLMTLLKSTTIDCPFWPCIIRQSSRTLPALYQLADDTADKNILQSRHLVQTF